MFLLKSTNKFLIITIFDSPLPTFNLFNPISLIFNLLITNFFPNTTLINISSFYFSLNSFTVSLLKKLIV